MAQAMSVVLWIEVKLWGDLVEINSFFFAFYMSDVRWRMRDMTRFMVGMEEATR